MKKKWKNLQIESTLTKNISRILKCSPIMASILVNKGLSSTESAYQFLSPSFDSITSPFDLKDATKASNRIKEAILTDEKILIFGDYDADGITSTTLLFDFLNYTGADVSYYIPDRTEGYDLHSHHIKDIAVPNEIDLIITVDCGSSSINAVNAANKEDIDVIITDHHQTGAVLPDAIAIINPKRDDCNSNLNNLAGVGVVFYLIICLRIVLRENNFWKILPEPNLKKYCDLVAIGTVADIVPLINENRVFVKAGLEIMSGNCRDGIEAILHICKVNKRYITSEDIGFRIAPQLNAAGRLKHADISVNLLQSTSFKKAEVLARNLNELNKERQKIEEIVKIDVLEKIEEDPNLLKKSSIVLASDKWHHGILGIVASRITSKYHKPTILIAIKDGIGKGSGRSISDFNMYKGLLKCETLLDKFGGHPMAAGLTIQAENIEKFQYDFNNVVLKELEGKEITQKIFIDYKLDFDDISSKLVNELEILQPFGCENKEPIFMTEDVHVISSSIICNSHRKLILKQGFSREGKQFNAINFNVDLTFPQPNHFKKIAFKLQWNRWHNQKNLQLIIEETQ